MLNKSTLSIVWLLLLSLTNQVNGEILASAATPARDDFLNFSLQQLIDTRVTVASLTEETVAQAPVPVTLITENMIKQSGAKTLKELLLSYVPGFTNVEDQNEINIAARGIFSSAQQKILIMINGHRLNSRSYSMATPDHSISLNKVQQIEVLRGPASSLYGNVSLTATINIILKSAQDMTHQQATVAVGNYGQKSANLLLGNSLKYADFIFWADTFHADGEKIKLTPENIYSEHPQPNSQAIIYGIKDKHPFDVGLSITTDIGDWLFNQRRSHYIEPYSAGGLSGEPYDYDSFEKVNGTGPGFGYVATHAEYKHNYSDQDWQSEIRVYYDQHLVETAVVVEPLTPTYLAPAWKERSLGLSSTLETKLLTGDLLLGIQLENYKVYAGELPTGNTSYSITMTDNNLLPSGTESNYSGFLQYKYPLTKNWRANLGLRYDYKNRKATNNINQISPRLGFVYQHQDVSIKFGYSEAFVDATYWNRFSKLTSFVGASNLKPEKLRSLQISPSINFPDADLQLTSNVFYDQSEDVIFRDNMATEVNYSNAGKLTTWGIEQELSYLTPVLNVRANATFRRAVSSEKIPVNNGYVHHVPKFTANIITDFSLTEQLDLHLAVRYIGKQYSPIVIQRNGKVLTDRFPEQGVDFYAPKNTEKAVFLVNANMRYNVNEQLSFGVRVDNVLNTQYKQGGTTMHPYQQKGRWFTVEMSINF
ncbi:TonB-dependent receptor [Thalassotalea sediminis]|uniref:TonB-dependent receptor n=1 Tax=Thalassotalea sediminis TaxID=1759089 RepID=UPI00257292A4|nr:TonB-dependent receptor [Thalassotalea sediminis]